MEGGSKKAFRNPAFAPPHRLQGEPQLFFPFPPLSPLTFLHLWFVLSLSSFSSQRGAGGASRAAGLWVCQERSEMCVFVCTAEGGVDMMRLQCCRDGLAE